MDEFSLIKNYFAPLARDFPGSLGLRDDTALLDPRPGEQFIITKDAMCEGVHFIGDENPALIAQKLLRVNLSDLAAKGASPLCYFLAIMAPKNTKPEWFAEFTRGLAADQEQYCVALAGGDTTATHGSLALSLTMVGTLPKGTMLQRSGARPGDQVFVSGTLGDAALGLHIISSHSQGEDQGGGYNSLPKREREFLVERYLLPQPRLELGMALRGIATSCMDISDGLLQDMGHIGNASGVGATLHQEKLPLSSAARALLDKNSGYWEQVVGGGDDYELLFTAPAKHRDAIKQLSDSLGYSISLIGEITASKTVSLLDAKGNPVKVQQPGFQHFK